MDKEFKSGFVSMMGRTNVGKSSIMNALVNEKVAAIANKPQTTRNAIRAIVNRPNSQIIFIDTPGIHKPKSKLGNTMVETAFGVANDVDVILFVIDATSTSIDLVKREDIAKLIELYKDEYNFEAVIPVSVVKQTNLDAILDEIEKHLKVGPAYYDIEEYTDQTMRQLVEETIREKALRLLNDEVPHGIYVETEKMKERTTKTGEPIYDVEATIYCLKKSHKGIIIGKDGNMLKRIASYARTDLEKMHDIKINLKVWVKVKEDWLNNDTLVKKFKLQ